ncbi:MAG: adenylate/guanylate cyclase domain-containing protein [Candidatus Binatia bacterium]
MKFSELLEQVRTWLERDQRISYRALKLEFDLTEDMLDALKEELIEAKRVAADENGKVLVWVGNPETDKGEGETDKGEMGKGGKGEPRVPSPQPLAERRQLTVLFCDLVGSTALSAQLDPEDYRAVVQGYQATATAVIERHHGYLAQHWGDGLLVYFGYPTAHEDEARRAVRAGLEIITALSLANGQEPNDVGARRCRALSTSQIPSALQVRIGVHTGLVVIGEIGGGEKKELLALGETPNIAARLQGLAEPNTVLISAATQRLIEGYFESQPFGSHILKGIATPVAVYQVQSERQGGSALERRATLTPLIGREQEVGLLIDRWEQAKEGQGQVVLLSGEPGIGKSRLAYTLKEHVTSEGSLVYEARCSPYHQQSALYPLIDVLQRTLLFIRQDTDEIKVAKLEQTLMLYEMQDKLPLFTALLSLSTPTQYPPLTLTPQKQKERTFQALVQIFLAQAERQATVSVWEDLHWADPSSLEFLSLLIEQIATTKLLLVLTFRPEFTPPWKPRSHISQLVLNRLGKKQVEAMIAQAAGKQLPPDVIEQIRLKTDGVPLFIEELTKSVIESATGVGAQHAAPLQLAIPATLQEALLARLDRLSTARQVAQLGATLGREFAYELLLAVAPMSEVDLQTALAKLVEAEILYQRGIGEQARYVFKHALIQDTAYQSLLKSTRQQYHQQIAQVLEERFSQTKKTQPELFAYHCTEAGLIEQAIPYWQQAGQKATERSAHTEAINHFTKGLELLKTLSDTPKRVEQELTLQVSLGAPLMGS